MQLTPLVRELTPFRVGFDRNMGVAVGLVEADVHGRVDQHEDP
jgi:hypothetical protein